MEKCLCKSINTNRFCIVVVFYNPTVNQVQYFVSLSEKYHVIALDNSDCRLREHFPINFDYIPFERNFGIAHALNVGLKRAGELGKFLWVLTLDQDSKISIDNFINKAFTCIDSQPKVGVVSPVFPGFSSNYKIVTGIRKVGSAMTSGSLINLSAFNEVAGFKEFLFIDLVDTDFCFNLRLHGYSIYQVRDVVLEHHLGNKGRSISICGRYLCSVTNHPAFRIYYMIRNLLWITAEYKSSLPTECKFLRKRIRGIILKVLFLENDKWNKIRYIYKGYCDYKHKKFGKLQ